MRSRLLYCICTQAMGPIDSCALRWSGRLCGAVIVWGAQADRSTRQAIVIAACSEFYDAVKAIASSLASSLQVRTLNGGINASHSRLTSSWAEAHNSRAEHNRALCHHLLQPAKAASHWPEQNCGSPLAGAVPFFRASARIFFSSSTLWGLGCISFCAALPPS